MLSKVLLDVGQLEEALGHLERMLNFMQETGPVGEYKPSVIESLVKRLRSDLGK